MVRRKFIPHVHEPGRVHEFTFSCDRRVPLPTNDDWRTRTSRRLRRSCMDTPRVLDLKEGQKAKDTLAGASGTRKSGERAERLRATVPETEIGRPASIARATRRGLKHIGGVYFWEIATGGRYK